MKLAVLSLGDRGRVAITERAGAGMASLRLLSGIAKNPKVLDDDHALAELCRFANAVGAITTTARGGDTVKPTVRSSPGGPLGSDETHGK